MNASPPFRADHVGSLLRPPELKQARADHAAGLIDAERLREVENAAIGEAVRAQERIGLRAVTDGEFRRTWWQFDFLRDLEGVELEQRDKVIQFHGVATRPVNLAITGRVAFTGHPMLDHFRFLNDAATAMAKFTIPAPAVLHFRGGRESISRRAYPDLEAFFRDVAETYKKIVAAFYEAGCRYLQLDDTVWGYLCSEKERAQARSRGDDPEPLPRIYAQMINETLSAKPADMVITTHVCRGNFRSSWISEGGYDPVAQVLLEDTNYDGYFLEYDTERAGGFEPLRHLPTGDKRVVLGLVTSKAGNLEDKDALKRRIEEASRFVDLQQLCLSPQCGFSSTEEGNLISVEEQWDKLGLVVEVAAEVWGDS